MESLQGLRVYIELILLVGGFVAAVFAATPKGIRQFKRAWGWVVEWSTDWRLRKVEERVDKIDPKG